MRIKGMAGWLAMMGMALAWRTVNAEAVAGAGAEPMTWGALAGIAGATAFTLLFVQFIKAPLDKIWKLPTRVVAYIVALVVMLLGTAFTTGLTVESTLLAAVNALIAALSAMGAYEMTFGKGKSGA